MKKSIIVPGNEAERLKKLNFYNVIDSAPEAAFDELTQLAAKILDFPIVVVSLIDENRQWFKSKVGFEGVET